MSSSALARCAAAFARDAGLRCDAEESNAAIARFSETDCTIAASALLASSQMKPFDSPAFLMRIGTIKSRSASILAPKVKKSSRKQTTAFLAKAERSESA